MVYMMPQVFRVVCIHCRVFWISHRVKAVKITDVSEELADSGAKCLRPWRRRKEMNFR